MGEPRILLFDLEIIPDLQKALLYWTKLSSFPGKTLRASVTSICCIGYKFFGEEETHCLCAWDFPAWSQNVNNDRVILEAFLPVIQSADLIVTHNGKNFDKKHLQTRLLLNGLSLPDDSPHADTKAISSRNFFFIDNKLQTIGEELFGERKLEHEGWDLWVKTHRGDPDAQETMSEYCKQDVRLLEKVYRKFRPKVKEVPNYNLFDPFKANCCPRCGSSRLVSNGIRVTATRKYRRYLCQDCQTWSRTDLKDEVPR